MSGDLSLFAFLADLFFFFDLLSAAVSEESSESDLTSPDSELDPGSEADLFVTLGEVSSSAPKMDSKLREGFTFLMSAGGADAEEYP